MNNNNVVVIIILPERPGKKLPSIPSLCKCELLLQLFKNCGNYLKIVAILLCFYYILINNCRNF